MLERRKRFGAFIIPILVIVLMTSNYSRLTGTENIRAIHIVTLITIGMAIGVLLRNIITHFASDKKKAE